MANSFVRYTGNGSTTQYAVNFTYRDQADITVTINGVATTAFTYNASGTQITFLPSKDVFSSIKFSPNILIKRMRELAFLNKGIKIIFVDSSQKKEKVS